MADKNVIIMMADGLEECEALNVVDVLRRAGIDLMESASIQIWI